MLATPRFPEAEPQRRKNLLEKAKLLRLKSESDMSSAELRQAFRLCFLLADTAALYVEWGQKYLDALENINSSDTLYKNAFICISAKYKPNPLSQYQTIQEGLRLLESVDAVSAEPAEIHWVKAQIYRKLPALLPHRPSPAPHVRQLTQVVEQWLSQLPDYFANEVLHFLYTEKALDLTEAKRLYSSVTAR